MCSDADIASPPSGVIRTARGRVPAPQSLAAGGRR